jgi:sterol desaturase/sphingolipid hydroxylase (fatty acid hydroxylase superfamily)
MPAREFLKTITFLLALMGALSFVELAIPLFAHPKTQRRTFTNLSLTVVTFLLNWGLYSAAAVVALLASIRQWGTLARFNVPSFSLVVISIFTLDLATYFAHVTMHKIPVLWRFHRVHHSDGFVDATTTFREHPLEGVWRFLWIIVPVWTLGLSASGVASYRILSAGNGLIEHSNIRLRQRFDGLVSLVWTTPNMHKIHHSRSPAQADSNYGNLLALCDRVFGTFRPTHEALGVRYGLESVDGERSESFGALMALPFESSRTTTAIQDSTESHT